MMTTFGGMSWIIDFTLMRFIGIKRKKNDNRDFMIYLFLRPMYVYIKYIQRVVSRPRWTHFDDESSIGITIHPIVIVFEY